MNLVFYSANNWKEIAETVHNAVFDSFRSKELARIDFAIVVWENEIPIGYMTCREMDSESIYIGYGGLLPDFRKNEIGVNAYNMCIEFLKNKYKRASMLIENSNYKMINFAMKSGFKCTGIRNAAEIYLEHTIEWSE